jgi:hypothetical protein
MTNGFDMTIKWKEKHRVHDAMTLREKRNRF